MAHTQYAYKKFKLSMHFVRCNPLWWTGYLNTRFTGDIQLIQPNHTLNGVVREKLYLTIETIYSIIVLRIEAFKRKPL